MDVQVMINMVLQSFDFHFLQSLASKMTIQSYEAHTPQNSFATLFGCSPVKNPLILMMKGTQMTTIFHIKTSKIVRISTALSRFFVLK